MTEPLSKQQLQALRILAISAARKAGEFIQSTERSELRHLSKNSGSSAASQIVTEVDIRSEEIIRTQLQDASSELDIAFVGEESIYSSPDIAKQRFECPYFWCVDPLDGTLPYAQGQSGYAVSIALIEQSGKPVIGVVYDPIKEVTYHATADHGVFIDGKTCVSNQTCPESLTVFSDDSLREHQSYDLIVEKMTSIAVTSGLGKARFVYGSGAVVNAIQTIKTTNACYVKLPKKQKGGGSIWDFAATACIAKQRGAWVSDIYGASLDLNPKDSLFMNEKGILYASSAILAQRIVESISCVDFGG